MEESQTTIEGLTDPTALSKIQRGWNKLDSITKYCIWMQPSEEYDLGVRDILDKLRSDYITEHPTKSFDLHLAKERNSKWRQMYEASKLNGTWRPL